MSFMNFFFEVRMDTKIKKVNKNKCVRHVKFCTTSYVADTL